MNKPLLTIITPYFDTYKYTLALAYVLLPQLNEEVEWIIVDDGCNEKDFDVLGVKVIHLEENSGNASIPRNIGIENARGEYITFIDSDDMVAPNYIEEVTKKIKESPFDYCYLSWRTKDNIHLIKEEPADWNTCVWNCIYNKKTIGETRFDPKRNLGEDKEFNRIVRKGKRENIDKVLYYYNWKRPKSISSRYSEGEIPFVKK
jgi:glycosyltransferase involved in cell wall biosynthesis